MDQWTEGYTSNIAYTYGYYPELGPQKVKQALLLKGIIPPKISTACELGFGQGISVNIHAATSNVDWYGTDFLPSQAGFAQDLARAANIDSVLSDQSFQEFCLRDDLPGFDFICMHGIWSWISDSNRKLIVDFVRRKLNVGGVLYVSYNAAPGWSNFTPIRSIMARYAEVLSGQKAGIKGTIDNALNFVEQLLETDPVFLARNPGLRARVNKLKEQEPEYLAHEYFNQHWQPMLFSDVAAWFEDCKLDYACSAHLLDHVDNINLSEDQISFLKSVEEPVLRESIRDVMTNQTFRRDYWVKGLRQMSPVEHREALMQQRVALACHRDRFKYTVKTSRGEAAMDEAIYNPILDFLADNKPHLLGDMVKEVNLDLPVVIQAMAILMGKHDVYLCQEDDLVDKVEQRARDLNNAIIKKARTDQMISFLANPVYGGGFSVGRLAQLFLLGRESGIQDSDELISFAWAQLKAIGHRLRKDGKPLRSDTENLAQLAKELKLFDEMMAPVLRSFRII